MLFTYFWVSFHVVKLHTSSSLDGKGIGTFRLSLLVVGPFLKIKTGFRGFETKRNLGF